MQLTDGDRPTVVGSGLIALDLIIASSGAVTHSVGGTCGNVLTLLAAQGVKVRPVGKTGDDIAGGLICAHMAAWGSDLSLILRTSGVLSRRIAEFTPTYGSIRHRFAFKCPGCRRRLPRSSALREEEARSLEIDWSSVDLFFFDRANSAGIYLANLAREAGATVMFEPPKSQADTRLYDAAAVADIVKYSAQDFKDSLPTEVTSQLKLLIETQDGKGLRYRHRQGAALGDWRSVPAFDAVQPRDAAGAGDWCTAGFIKEMVEHKKTWSWTSPELESALAYGQALAAISVCFLGPLGALLALPGEDLTFAGQEVLRKGSVPEWARLQREEDRAFGPAWPLDLRPTHGTCEVCLLELSAV